MRVLLADDDPVTRRLLEATLTKLDLEVILAEDGAAAWRILGGLNRQESARQLHRLARG